MSHVSLLRFSKKEGGTCDESLRPRRPTRFRRLQCLTENKFKGVAKIICKRLGVRGGLGRMGP